MWHWIITSLALPRPLVSSARPSNGDRNVALLLQARTRIELKLRSVGTRPDSVELRPDRVHEQLQLGILMFGGLCFAVL